MEQEREKQLEVSPHFTYVTRSLIRLFNEGRLTNVDSLYVEPEYGYLARVGYTDGSYRITYGNDLGLNTGTSSELAKDKVYTKKILAEMDVKVPEGEGFLLPWWADRIREKNEAKGHALTKTTDEINDYVENTIQYPVYIKPVAGSKGGDVFKVNDPSELQDIIDMYNEKQVRLAVVEAAIDMPDYRVVVLDGKLISAYQRVPLAVVGNGVDNTAALINDLQSKYEKDGRDTLLNPSDPRIIRYLGQKGLGLDYIPPSGETFTLASISNLSAGGTSVDVTETIDQKWVDLAAKIAKGMNLRLCGVDLACVDITDGESDYSVLEVNSAPGLDHYAMSGEAQKQIVDDLYVRVLNVSVPQAA